MGEKKYILPLQKRNATREEAILHVIYKII